MNINPVVSAIIPTYNRSHVVCEAIDSVLAQTYSHMEVIVVDDGSKDDTVERLKQYRDRIRVVHQTNAGPAAARNRGIAVSRGELIAFLDSDDIWLPQMIERQVALLGRAGESVPCCFCNILMKWNSGDRTSFEIALLKPDADEGVWLNPEEILATRFVLFTQGSVIRRDVLERIGGFDTNIRYLEDYELPLRLSLEGPWAFIKEPLVIWRESMTNSVSKNSARDEICTGECLIEIFEKHRSRSAGHATLGKLILRELSRNRWYLRAAKLRMQGTLRAAALADLLALVQRIRKAAFVRSPWFPKMSVTSLQDSIGFQQSSSLTGSLAKRSV